METRQDIYPSRLETLERPYLPRLDPVVFGQRPGEIAGPLDEAQIATYERYGFLRLPGYIDSDRIEELRQVAARLRDGMPADDERVIREPGSRQVRSVFDIHNLSGIMASFCAGPDLAGVARQLLDSPVYLHQTRLNYKPGFEGKEFYWHSDFETWHAEDGMPRMRALSCVVALSDNHACSGPLMIIPGSHQLFVGCRGRTPDRHYLKSLERQEYGVPNREALTMMVDKWGIETMSGEAGTVIFFDCNAMHGSAGNITPYPRNNLFFVYNAIENRLTDPFGGTAPRPEYIASRHFEPI